GAVEAFASGCGTGASLAGTTGTAGLDFSLDCAVFWPGGATGGLKKYWETNITAPIRMKASSSRTSIDMSLGGLLPLPPITGSAIQMVPLDRTSPDGIDSSGLKRMAARQPAQPHPKSSPHAMNLYSLAHVFRARR